jgi:hypothetical protein
MLALSRRIPRPSTALVVAFAALFTALGGTGYAALKITGKNVANSSLTGLDVKNKSLGPQEVKPDSLGGDQISEAALGTVPSAQHAATADAATKALDADKVGGLAPTDLMLSKPRAYEANIASTTNFPNGSTLGTLPGRAPRHLRRDGPARLPQPRCHGRGVVHAARAGVRRRRVVHRRRRRDRGDHAPGGRHLGLRLHAQRELLERRHRRHRRRQHHRHPRGLIKRGEPGTDARLAASPRRSRERLDGCSSSQQTLSGHHTSRWSLSAGVWGWPYW